MFSWISTLWSAGKDILNGKSLTLYLGIALAFALLLCWALWLKTNLSTSEANFAALQTAYASQGQALSDIRTAYAEQEKALAAREATITTINSQREALRRKLGEVIAHDQDARDWASQPVPASVRGLLQ
jgi:septal ring factor EnvC (AmiA/AmiB activator)